MKKRLLSALLALCMMLALVPGSALAAEESGGYLIEENRSLVWRFNADTGVLTISGIGDWKPDDYKHYILPWVSFRDKIKEVKMEPGISSLFVGGFARCSNLTKITIADTVTEIESGVFSECGSLSNIHIPGSVVELSGDAFDGCSSLTNIAIPKSVANFSRPSHSAYFYKCKNLTAINVEEGNPTYFSLGGALFTTYQNGTKALLRLPSGYQSEVYSVPEGIGSIGQYALQDCRNLTSVVISDGVSSIGDAAFAGCTALTNVTVPDSVTQMGSGSRYDGGIFRNCSSLVTASLPANIKYIGSSTFNGCGSLQAVFIPSSVRDIRAYAFNGCEQLKDIYFGGTEAQWKALTKGDNNVPLTTAAVHYNSTGIVDPDRYQQSNSYIFTPAATGGTVVLSKRNALPGDWVNVYVTPDEGYRLESLTVTDLRGWPVAVREMGENAFSFTMPGARVNVAPVFVKAEEDSGAYSTAVPGAIPSVDGSSPNYGNTVLNPAAMNYADVNAGDWFYEDVRFCHQRYLMNKTGEAEGKFEPNAPATRAAVWTALSRLAGRNTITQGDNWYDRAQIWAKGKGITDGENPVGTITREQLVTMLWRYSGNRYVQTDCPSRFNDSASVSWWATEAVNWAAAVGIINGANGDLNPQGEATRAEVASILTRFCQFAG